MKDKAKNNQNKNKNQDFDGRTRKLKKNTTLRSHYRRNENHGDGEWKRPIQGDDWNMLIGNEERENGRNCQRFFHIGILLFLSLNSSSERRRRRRNQEGRAKGNF